MSRPAGVRAARVAYVKLPGVPAFFCRVVRPAGILPAVERALVQVQGHDPGQPPQVVGQGPPQRGQEAGQQVAGPGQQGEGGLPAGRVLDQGAGGGQGRLPAGGQQQEGDDEGGRQGGGAVGQVQLLQQQTPGVRVDVRGPERRLLVTHAPPWVRPC